MAFSWSNGSFVCPFVRRFILGSEHAPLTSWRTSNFATFFLSSSLSLFSSSYYNTLPPIPPPPILLLHLFFSRDRTHQRLTKYLVMSSSFSQGKSHRTTQLFLNCIFFNRLGLRKTLCINTLRQVLTDSFTIALKL